MSIQILIELFEDADLLGLIAAGALPTEYDLLAEDIFRNVSRDLSIKQIQQVVWDSFYDSFCNGTIYGENGEEMPFALDKTSAISIIGTPERYKEIAGKIRQEMFKEIFNG
jgi:hypothetical protein